MNTIFPESSWQSVDAEAQGWRSDLLTKAGYAAAEFGSISAVVVHKGQVIVGADRLDEKVLIRSMRKSFLSALVGIEVARGRIELDATMQDLAIDDVEGLTQAEKQATVRQLLQARSGIYHPALAESKEMRAAKLPRGSKEPGSYWLYNNWDFNALGTIYERATGQSVFEGVYRDIAVPIGMEDFQASDGAYLKGEQSIHPAYHMRMTARDLARFGWLFLNRGNWNGLQVVPEGWVHESLTAHSFDGTNGYGYMWWTTGHQGEAQNPQPSVYRKHLPPFRFFAHGHYGQMIAVMPEKEVVISHLAQSIERPPEQMVKLWEFVALVMEAHAGLSSAQNS